MLNIAYVNLRTLLNNALEIRNALPAKTKFYAVVKADGYGHGAAAVANALYLMTDGFCVASVEEGVLLRHTGIDKEIITLVPTDDEGFRMAIKNDLTLPVASANEARRINCEARRLCKIAKVHIAVNTGMNRFGETVPNLWKIVGEAKSLESLSVTGVFSHFYNPQDDESVKKQTEIFDAAVKTVKEAFPCAVAHIAASGGTIKGAFYDAVRVGLLLYGYYPFKCKLDIKVKPCMNVVSSVVELRRTVSGENALYGDYRIETDEDYAIIRFGYADGLPRREVDGQLNKRCMDVTAVKMGGSYNQFSKKTKKNGKFYILYKNADELAEKYDTISYDVLTSVAKRAVKIYLR